MENMAHMIQDAGFANETVYKLVNSHTLSGWYWHFDLFALSLTSCHSSPAACIKCIFVWRCRFISNNKWWNHGLVLHCSWDFAPVL